MLPNGEHIGGRCYDVLAALARTAIIDHQDGLDASRRRTMTPEQLANALCKPNKSEMQPQSAYDAIGKCRKTIASRSSLDPTKVIETPKRGYRLHPSVSFTLGAAFVKASAMPEPAAR